VYNKVSQGETQRERERDKKRDRERETKRERQREREIGNRCDRQHIEQSKTNQSNGISMMFTMRGDASGER